MRKKLLLLLLLTSCLPLFSQSWQWGKQGGGSDAIATNGSIPVENAARIAVDNAGNTYAISTASQTGLNVDGNPNEQYAQSALLSNGILVSFDCEGSYRWSKVIGGENGGLISDVKTDSQGNVYITGNIIPTGSGTQNHFDSDLILPYATDNGTVGTNFQSIYIAKYTSTGSLLWVRFPEADNVSVSSYNYGSGGINEISIDPQDNLYLLSNLNPGIYANGAYTNSFPGRSVHMLQYSPTGNFVAGHHLNIDLNLNTAYYILATLRMARNSTSGAIYITATNNAPAEPVVGGLPITTRMFLMAFNPAGDLQWKVANTSNDFGRLMAVTLDSDGAIYVTGATSSTGPNTFDYGDSFAGHIFPSEADYYSLDVAFVMKLDALGQAIWSSNASYYASGTSPDGIVVNGNEVAIATEVPLIRWDGHELGTNNPENQQLNPGIVRLKKSTGQVIDFTEITGSNNTFNGTGSITADWLGNYYLGGELALNLYPGTSSLLNSGGETDFFVAKYGTGNCDCQVPTCSYNATGSDTSNTISFDYLGQDVYDSVSWDFGDGSPVSAAVNPDHSFASTGTYTVCVTAANSCDTYTYCNTVTISTLDTEGNNLQNPISLLLYPNPAHSGVTISYSAKTNPVIELYDVTGRRVVTHVPAEIKGNWQLNLEGMAAGLYLVLIKEGGVVTGTKKLLVL